MSYELRCHCGAVQGEVDGDLPTEALICNCSHCSAKGLALSAISREQLRLTAGEGSLRTYQFNSKAIHHRFCGECGTQPFAEGQGPDARRWRWSTCAAYPQWIWKASTRSHSTEPAAKPLPFRSRAFTPGR